MVLVIDKQQIQEAMRRQQFHEDFIEESLSFISLKNAS
jgi:hypothetical protein